MWASVRMLGIGVAMLAAIADAETRDFQVRMECTVSAGGLIDGIHPCVITQLDPPTPNYTPLPIVTMGAIYPPIPGPGMSLFNCDFIRIGRTLIGPIFGHATVKASYGLSRDGEVFTDRFMYYLDGHATIISGWRELPSGDVRLSECRWQHEHDPRAGGIAGHYLTGNASLLYETLGGTSGTAALNTAPSTSTSTFDVQANTPLDQLPLVSGSSTQQTLTYYTNPKYDLPYSVVSYDGVGVIAVPSTDAPGGAGYSFGLVGECPEGADYTFYIHGGDGYQSPTSFRRWYAHIGLLTAPSENDSSIYWHCEGVDSMLRGRACRTFFADTNAYIAAALMSSDVDLSQSCSDGSVVDGGCYGWVGAVASLQCDGITLTQNFTTFIKFDESTGKISFTTLPKKNYCPGSVMYDFTDLKIVPILNFQDGNGDMGSGVVDNKWFPFNHGNVQGLGTLAIYHFNGSGVENYNNGVDPGGIYRTLTQGLGYYDVPVYPEKLNTTATIQIKCYYENFNVTAPATAFQEYFKTYDRTDVYAYMHPEQTGVTGDYFLYINEVVDCPTGYTIDEHFYMGASNRSTTYDFYRVYSLTLEGVPVVEPDTDLSRLVWIAEAPGSAGKSYEGTSLDGTPLVTEPATLAISEYCVPEVNAFDVAYTRQPLRYFFHRVGRFLDRNLGAVVGYLSGISIGILSATPSDGYVALGFSGEMVILCGVVVPYYNEKESKCDDDEVCKYQAENDAQYIKQVCTERAIRAVTVPVGVYLLPKLGILTSHGCPNITCIGNGPPQLPRWLNERFDKNAKCNLRLPEGGGRFGSPPFR